MRCWCGEGNPFSQKPSCAGDMGGEGWQRGMAGRRSFCWSFQSDFTNEMGKYYQTGRGGNNGHPVLCFLKLPSMAIFPLVVYHFISKMADCTQQQKFLPLHPPLPVFPACVPGAGWLLRKWIPRGYSCE